jgi:hypothetical protein
MFFLRRLYFVILTTSLVAKALPNEIEKLLLRPDVSSHVARTFSSAVTPIIERHVKDAINKTLIPAYTAQSSAMHQELSREIHAEMLNLKKEVISWQSEALRGQEVCSLFWGDLCTVLTSVFIVHD